MALNSEDLWKLKNVDFGIENIVFEGGGAKGMAFTGVMEVLHEVGIYQNMKRYCGVSMGAVFATLMALGDTPKQIKQLCREMDSHVFMDATCGYLAFIPNILWSYGWNPAKNFYDIMSREIRKRYGDHLLTFGKLYHDHGKELCIVVSNMSTANVEYFHPKTTPDFPIMEALAMTVSMPVLMKPKYACVNGRGEYFVDGGVLNNYPIDCFDGWYLSMDPEDSFLHREAVEEERNKWFEGYSQKTIGALVFSNEEREVFKREFGDRMKNVTRERPKTKLMKERLPRIARLDASIVKQHEVNKTAEKLFDVLKKKGLDLCMQITTEQFQDAIESSQITTEEYEILFGKSKPDEVFAGIDVYNDGFVTIHTLGSYFTRKGVPIQHGFNSKPSFDIGSLTSFLFAVIDSIQSRQKEVVIKGHDLQRSIGIDCDYVCTTDDLEEADIDFLITQGRQAAIAFLKNVAGKKLGEQIAQS